jgi:hypothetical protein
MLVQLPLLPDAKPIVHESGRVIRNDPFKTIKRLIAESGHPPPPAHDRTALASIDHVMRAGGCHRPIRLTGNGQRIDTETGEILGPWSTDGLPSGVAYVACKTRRKSKCAVCSWLYQGDAYQLIHAGLTGGDKDTPEEVADHPAVFVTLTAPSFGKVHTQRRDTKGSIRPCQSGKGDKCRHGNPTVCTTRHGDGDDKIGQALCPRCYDYESAVLWNAHASELWRRTRIQLDRILAKHLEIPRKQLKDHLRIQYVKVAEFQKRGLVHFHAVIRVDGPNLEDDSPVDTATLTKAIDDACKQVKARMPNGKRARWGKHRTIDEIAPEDAPVTRGQAAGYLAKYSLKSADGHDALDQRIGHVSDFGTLKVNRHTWKMAHTSWQLASRHPEHKGRSWAHQLGYRGHFMTKSRKWSTTFSALRQARTNHVQEVRKQSWTGLSEQTLTTIKAKWSYVGNGYATSTDRWIAEVMRNKERTSRKSCGVDNQERKQ